MKEPMILLRQDLEAVPITPQLINMIKVIISTGLPHIRSPRQWRRNGLALFVRGRCSQLPLPTHISTVHSCSIKSLCSFPHKPPPPLLLLLHQPQCQRQKHREKYLLPVRSPDNAVDRRTLPSDTLITITLNCRSYLVVLVLKAPFLYQKSSWLGTPFPGHPRSSCIWMLLSISDSPCRSCWYNYNICAK